MGIDRHELEHRNWRSSAAKAGADKSPERDTEVAPLDVTIIPDDVGALAPNSPSKPARKSRKSTTKAKTNA